MRVKKQFIHQALFTQAPFTYTDLAFFFLIGGYGCGKTSALVDLTLKTIQYFAGKKDLEGKNPKIGICGITLTFLKKTFSGSLTQVFDSTKTPYSYDKANNILFVAGVELHLTGIADEENIFGFDWCAALVDELDELPTYKAINVVKSLNDRCRQVIPGKRRAFIAFATTSQGLKGTYQVVNSLKMKGVGHLIIRGRTRDNTALDKKKVADLYKMYSKKEIECLLEGKFVAIDSGKPYSDYDPVKCKLSHDLFDSVRPEETVYIGQDFNSGFNKAVALIIREGTVYVIKEYAFPDLRSAPKVMRYDFPKNIIKWIPDATGSEKVMMFRKELRSHNIRVMLRKKNPLIQDRIFLVNKMFYTERMYVCPFCKNLDNALIIRQNDPKTGLPMKGTSESAPDHLCDALEYAITYMVMWLRELKDIYSITLGRRIEKRIEAGLEDEEDSNYADASA